jgi:hypothetical protein
MCHGFCFQDSFEAKCIQYFLTENAIKPFPMCFMVWFTNLNKNQWYTQMICPPINNCFGYELNFIFETYSFRSTSSCCLFVNSFNQVFTNQTSNNSDYKTSIVMSINKIKGSKTNPVVKCTMYETLAPFYIGINRPQKNICYLG